MRLQKFNYSCKNCGYHFQANELGGDFIYGEFILRSEGFGSEAYLNAINDSVFEEVSNMLKENKFFGSKSDLERSKILHDIFGIACDPDIDGSLFQINLDPKCPNCSQRNIADWRETFPPVFVDINTPHVTHDRWNALSIYPSPIKFAFFLVSVGSSLPAKCATLFHISESF